MSEEKALTRLLELAENQQLHHGLDPEDQLHGKTHWKEVATLGTALALQEGQDTFAAQAFGLLHDCCRIDDNHDPEHGPRASEWMLNNQEIKDILGLDRAKQVAAACRIHTLPYPTSHPFRSICLDADRLTLYRVGLKPQARFFSTKTAKDFIQGRNKTLHHGKPGFTLAYHGSKASPKGKFPSPQKNILYTALDKPSAEFYGKVTTLFCSFENLADLTDPMGLIKTPIFSQLKEYNQRNFGGRFDGNGEPLDIFNLLEAGDIYHKEYRTGQEALIKTVFSWGYDAVLLQDISHSLHATLALNAKASIQRYEPYK